LEQLASFFEQLASFLEQLASFFEQDCSLAICFSFLLHDPALQLCAGLSWASTTLEAIRAEASKATDLMFMVKFL